MKTIKIHINELGAVRNSVVELKPLMIFSGESGLGKSYVAILVHYFYKVLADNRLQAFFSARGWDYDTMVSKNPEEASFSFTTPMLIDWITEEAKAYMREAVGNPNMVVDVEFEIPFSRDSYTFSYRTVQIDFEGKEETSRVFELGNSSMRIDGDAKSLGSLPWSILMQSALRNELLDGHPLDRTFAMVPGRGALLTIPVTMQERIRNNGDIYSEFLTDWSVVQSMSPRKNIDRHLLERLAYINGGSIDVDDNDRLIYRMLDGRVLPISAAASSIKELAPLYMLLDKYPSNHLSILFEEPEAHLHPQMQVNIADFVVSAVNHGMHLQITTHSDYFLRRLNDRIFLQKIQSHDAKHYAETLQKYGYTDLTLDSSLIGAYLLRREEDDSVKVVPQELDKGIPYESFYNVIRKESRHSLDIQQTYFNIKQEDHAE